MDPLYRLTKGAKAKLYYHIIFLTSIKKKINKLNNEQIFNFVRYFYIIINMKKEEINELMKEFFNKNVDSFKYSQKRLEDIELFLKDFSLVNYNNVLDVACGAGIISSYLSKNNKHVIGIDLSSKMIETAKIIHNENNLEFYNEDFYKFNNENKFDLIVIFNAYPHFLDIKLFIEALKRLLNKKGRVVILHDNNKEFLNDKHSEVAKKISRMLKDVDEEIKYFTNDFNINRTLDNKNSYLIDMNLK